MVINHRILLGRLMGIIDHSIDISTRIQIARRILAQNFNQVLAHRKQNTNMTLINNSLYSVSLTKNQFLGTAKLTCRAYLELFYFFLNYTGTLLSPHPSPKHSKNHPYNLFFGYDFSKTKVSKIQAQLSEYFEFFQRTHNLPSFFVIEQRLTLRKVRLNNSSLFTFSPILSILIMRYSPFFRLKVFFRLVYEVLHFILVIPFLGIRRLAIKDIFLQKWMSKILIDNQIPLNLYCNPNNLFVQNILFQEKLACISRNMIWYSASAIKGLFDNDWYIDETLYFDLPIDVHYVWTEEHARFLSNSKYSKVKVVGPQLFYLPSKKPIRRRGKKEISVMDLTPTNWALYDDTVYGEKRGLWFLNQVEAALESLDYQANNVTVTFKFKRENSLHYSIKYMNRVKELCDKGLFTTVAPDINLFDHISNIDCLITTRLTSVGLIAENLRKKVIYLDPFYDTEVGERINVSNSSQLREALLSI